MPGEPLVSVIMCNFNYARYLPEAIESVLTQSYRSFELIVVDDGSTDCSRDEIARYSDSRVRTIVKEQGGQASAFNAGFSAAHGEIVAFLDSDDAWRQDKLELCVAALLEGGHALVQHNLQTIDGSSRPLGRLHPAMAPGVRDVFSLYFIEQHTDFFCPTSALVCRKEDLDRIFPLDPDWRICADVAFVLLLPLFGTVCTLAEPCGYYRIHNANGWMNSPAQSEIVANGLKVTGYLNARLAEFGIQKNIDYHRSRAYFEATTRGLALFSRVRLRLGLAARRIAAWAGRTWGPKG